MRRALAVLAALVGLAATADARTLVLTGYSRTLSSELGQAPIEYVVPEILRAYGATFDIRHWSVADTATLRTGLIGGVQYDVIVHAGWHVQAVSNQARRANLLTTNARWPLIPHVFICSAAFADAGQMTSGAADSTGNAGVAPLSNDLRYRQYDAATGAGWHTGLNEFVDLDGTLNPKNVWRPVLKVGGSSVWTTLGGGAPVAFREALAAPALHSATADSCVMYAKYVSADVGIPRLTTPLIFAVGAGTQYDFFPTLAALAMADSASGRRVFDNSARVPQKAAIFIGPWFATGNHRNTTYKSGIFCAADSCDTANVHTTLDSLRALGVKLTVGVQVDSLSALAYQKPYLQLLGQNFRVTPMDWSGVTANSGMADGNARKHRVLDPLGITRARTLIPPGATRLPWACSEGDSSIYCLMKAAYAALDSAFPGKVDRTLVPPGGNATYGWSRQITRANGRTLDSLVWVLYMAGVRGIVVDPLDAALPGQAGPWGNLLTASGYYPVRDSAGYVAPGQSGGSVRRVIYRMPIVASRNYEVNGASWGVIPSHDIGMEFAWGRWITPWYGVHVQGAGPHWGHNFQTGKLFVYSVATSSLGGAGQGTTPNRPAYWQIRKMVLQNQMMTRLAGRELFHYDWLDGAVNNPGGLE